MTILVIGAGGFIGRHVARALEDAGYEVLHGTRAAYDFARHLEPGSWKERLQGVQLVVNAAGIFREGRERFDEVHFLGPRALFIACAELGIKVVQVSALGADDGARSRFHLTKKAADDALLTLKVPSVILQPALVYGEDGASARMFTLLASLPLVPLPGAGEQAIQPVHVEDLAAGVVSLVRADRFRCDRVAAVGPEPTTLKRFLTDLRRTMGLPPPRYWFIPARWIDVLAPIAGKLRSPWLDRDAWAMLRRGNTADVAAFRAILGREPRAVVDFIAPAERRAVLLEAKLGWLLPLLRFAIAIVWIVAGVVSAGIYPVEESRAMLARVGLTGALATVALYGAALFDLAMGLATLLAPRRRLLWIAQMAAILAYTAIITVALPEQWAHPFGPVVKNLPLLAAIYLLLELEPRRGARWNT